MLKGSPPAARPFAAAASWHGAPAITFGPPDEVRPAAYRPSRETPSAESAAR